MSFAAAALALTCLSISGVSAGGGVENAHGPPVLRLQSTVTATIVVSPLRVSLRLGATTVRAGTAVSARESVANVGRTRLSRVMADIEPQPDLNVKPANPQSMGTLGARSTETVPWWLCVTRPGTYAIEARATAQDAAGYQLVGYSGRETLVVTGRTARCD